METDSTAKEDATTVQGNTNAPANLAEPSAEKGVDLLDSMEHEPRIDLRDQFVSLVVRPGTPVVAQHLRESRQVMAHMSDFLEEFSKLEAEHARKLHALSNSAHAKFETASVTQRATSWLGLKSSGVATETISEYGTTNAAWQSVRDGVTAAANVHQQMGALVQAQIVDSMQDYLNETQAQTDKTEGWGLRLNDAMNNYIRKAEEAKQTYHSRAKTCRSNFRFLEEAEKQAQIGGITRGVILTSSRLAKLKETAEQSRMEELSSANQYRSALEMVAKKQNELYTIRLPRVFQEIQRLTEDRTERIKLELSKFAQIGQDSFPALLEVFSSLEAPVQGINSSIDSRVFVASKVADDSLPLVFEFEAYDQQSLALVSSGDAFANQTVVESDLVNLLADQKNRENLIAILEAEEDLVTISAISFFHNVELFRNGAGDTSAQAVAIHHKYLADDATELVPLLIPQKTELVARVIQDDTRDKSMFQEAAKHVLEHIEANSSVQAWIKQLSISNSTNQKSISESAQETQEGKVEPKPKPPPPNRPPSRAKSDSTKQGIGEVENLLGLSQESSHHEKTTSSPPVSKAPQMVLLQRQSTGATLQEDDLLDSDDELLNRTDRIDDVLLGDDSFIDDDEDVEFE